MDTKITYRIFASLSKKRIEKLFEEAQAEIKKVKVDTMVEKYKVSSEESAV